MPFHLSKRYRWFLRIGFALALAVTVVFGARTVLSVLYWNNPDHIDRQIEGWMPVGYVGRSWGIPRDVMGEIANVDMTPRHGLSLEQIAQDQGISLGELIAQITTGIQAYRDAHHD